MADSILPYTAATCSALLIIFLNFVSKSYSHSQSDVFLQSPKDHLLCRQCGADLASSGSIVNRLSPEAAVVVNQTLFGKTGVEIQVLINPLGIQFGLITVSKAFCVGIAGKWHTEFSWFPGYAWKHCMCNYCSSVLGWMFEPIETATSERIFPSTKGFCALILNQILSETCKHHFILLRIPCWLSRNLIETNKKMPDPSLTEEQKNFIAECEAEFQDRFTQNDEAFMKIHTSESSKPPIVDPWYNKPRRNFDWSRQNRNQNRRNNYWERRHGDRSERIERQAGRQHLYSNRHNAY